MKVLCIAVKVLGVVHTGVRLQVVCVCAHLVVAALEEVEVARGDGEGVHEEQTVARGDVSKRHPLYRLHSLRPRGEIPLVF